MRKEEPLKDNAMLGHHRAMEMRTTRVRMTLYFSFF